MSPYRLGGYLGSPKLEACLHSQEAPIPAHLASEGQGLVDSMDREVDDDDD